MGILVRRLQTLRKCRLPRGLPHRRHRAHRVWRRLHPARRLQRLRILRRSVSLLALSSAILMTAALSNALSVMTVRSPACNLHAQSACPTESIRFGALEDMRQSAHDRITDLKKNGFDDVHLYDPVDSSVGGIHALFIVRGDPQSYNLPDAPEVPTVQLKKGWVSAGAAAGLMFVGSLLAFWGSPPTMSNVHETHTHEDMLLDVREARLRQIREQARIVPGKLKLPDTSLQQPSADTGYYGKPLLKPPAWTFEVPLYFFTGGAAGAAAIIAAAAQMTGAPSRLIRDARYLAAIGGTVSPALLIADLGMPSRFLNMLRVFKIQSPMSVGSWTLFVFSSSSAAAAFLSAAA